MHDSDLTRKSDPKYDDDLVNKRYVDNEIKKVEEHHVVESGSNANGYWIKFSDGTMIQGKYLNSQTFSFLSWYNAIAYKDFTMGNWEIPFVGTPRLLSDSCVFTNNDYDNQGWVTNSPRLTSTNAGTMRLCRPSDASTISFTVDICRTAIGRWK